MIFRFLLAVSVLALLDNVVAPPPPPAEYQNLRNLRDFFRRKTRSKHDAIKIKNIQPHKSSPPPPTPRLKPCSFPSDHDHTPLDQTVTALKDAAKDNFKTSGILHHGADQFTEHCNYGYGTKHHLHRTAEKYRKAANEHYTAAYSLSSKAQSLKSASASGQVSATELQALNHYAKASTAKAQSNKNIATAGIASLEDAKIGNYLHRLEKNRGEQFYAEHYKKTSKSEYNAATYYIPELDATQSIHSP